MQQSQTAGFTAGNAGYWRSKLDRLGEKSCLPADLRPEPGATSATAVHTVRLSPELTKRLDRVSRSQPAALHVVLSAALVALLGRYTRQDEVVIGQPTESAGPDCAGSFVVLRVEPRGSFRELLKTVESAVREAVVHQDFGLGQLADEFGRTSSDGENPYFDVGIELVGLHAAGLSGVRMLLTWDRDGDSLTLVLHYDSTRFAEANVAQIGSHYKLLLDRATAEPDRPVHEIPLYTQQDQEIIAAANATERKFDDEATIHEVFAMQALRTPNAPALLEDDSTVTFAEFDAKANQLARVLQERGVGPDVIVAVVVERSAEMMVAITAILKAGGAYLPVDPSYPQARIDYLLADSGARLAVAQRKFERLIADIPVVNVDDADSYVEEVGPVESKAGARNLAYVIYTSGSTGQPKGVQVEHRSVVNRMTWVQRAYPIGPSDVVLQKTSISFDLSIAELFWGAFSGAALAILKPAGEKDPAAVVAAIDKHKVTTIQFVPTVLGAFLGHVDRFGTGSQLDNLRRVMTNGEAQTPNLVKRCAELLPGVQLVNCYGPTESTVDVTHHPCERLDTRSSVPIGRPMDNVRIYVLDEVGQLNPIGIPGELHIAGAGLARGYLNRPELTAERFVSGRQVGEQRLYRTGDLARWLPDGTLDHMGRIDLQVKVRGFRIEPAEIEERLRAHPAVQDAAVVPHDEGWQVSLRGFVTLRGEASEGNLKQHLREALPEYMVPSRILVLNAMPLSPNGKLERAALSRPGTRRQAPAHVEPRNERERLLAGIWAEVLGMERVGVQDNFFELGGNSIHFVSVLAKSRVVGLDFTFQQLFRRQTIAALIADMGEAPTTAPAESRKGYQLFELLRPEDRAKIPDGVVDAYPLSMMQAGLIFQTELMGERGQYHDLVTYTISGYFDQAAFENAVRWVVSRHPILRSTYHLTGFSEFIQIVHKEVSLPLHVTDLSELDEEEQARWHEDWRAKEKARRFVWEDGEVVSLHVQILTDGSYLYTISQHCSALDGWSMSVLNIELFEQYHQIRMGSATDLSPGDNHLRNFIGLEAESTRSSQSREFWEKVLDGTAPTTLPRALERSDTADYGVIFHEVEVPKRMTERIVDLADSLSVPVKDVLLAAHVKVISAVAGDGEVITGYEHSGRPELAGADHALGVFLNSVPLRVGVTGGTWASLIEKVYETELELLPHRRYPMARMKQDLATHRTFFETTFNFTHFYLMKKLEQLPAFSLSELRADSETEFVFRTEFQRDPSTDELQLSLHYHGHVFGAEHIERIGGYFVRALELMAEDPDASHSLMSLADEEELALLRKFADAEHAQELVATRYPELASRGGLLSVQVLDESLVPAPLGTPGEIVVGPHRTGDRGRWLLDGRLEFLTAGEREQESTGPDVESRPIAPASQPTVDKIAEAWAKVLGLSRSEIGASADYFELGGNSLSALRVVLELNGMVTLTDMTLCPTLDLLARRVDERQTPEEELLYLLSSDGSDVQCALVCVPYPGGHPINFKPLAESVEKADSGIAVYAVELPGHDLNRGGELVDVEETARRVVAAIEEKADLPLILWGHCGGAPVVMEVARLLEDEGFDLRHVFVGSKLLPTVAEMQENIAAIECWTGEEVVHYMAVETGYTELGDLAPAQMELLGEQFRHDVCTGYRYLIDASERQEWKLTAPLTGVVADDDPVLQDVEAESRRWSSLAADVRFQPLDSGGHYFVRTNSAAAAELIIQAWAFSTGM